MFKQQLYALLWRNFIVKKKRKRRTIAEIALPVYMIATLVILQKTVVTNEYSEIKETKGNLPLWITNSIYENVGNKESIGIVPNNRYTIRIRNFLRDIVSTKEFLIYSTKEDLLAAYHQNDSSLIAGIIFSNNPMKDGSYVIKLPLEKLPSHDMIYSTPADCRDFNGTEMFLPYWKCPAIKYYTSGFSYLQAVADTALFKLWKGDNSSDVRVPDSKISIYPKPSYKDPGQMMQIILPLYLVISLSPIVANLIISIVYEKEKKIKEGMLIMGMLQSSFWLAWFIIEAALILVLTIVMSVIISVAVLPNTNAVIVFILMFLYGLSLIMFAFMLTPFFSKSKVAGSVVGFMVALFSVVHLLAVYLESQLSTFVFTLLALLSPAACGIGLKFVVDMEIAGTGVSFSNMFEGKFSPGMAVIMLVIDIGLYGLLALYFDLVIPGEFGPRHQPWFFLMPSYWKNTKMSHIVPEEELCNRDDVEMVPAELHAKEAIIINNIKKSFTKCRKGEVKAVTGVNLEIYEDQITALLGHNGAGKTTLMNVLVGMTPPTSGSAHVYGLNIANAKEQSQIRRMTGICMQENILIDELSCRDHLIFFAKLKCVPSEQCEREVDQILADLCLTDCQNTDSKSLSGGQKRKLCVGIALIGDPKIIFLDEPSSGVDPYSRRQMWSLLQRKKEGRVIVLTTHFMDEADILADRKAIMSRGRIRCVGSSFFLKNKFGIGYHLIVEVDSTDEKHSITNIVQDHIPSASFSRIAASELSYLLPLNQTENFPKLFSAIEQACSTNLHGMKGYGVSMTTLEEVFIALGEEHIEDENGKQCITNIENELITRDIQDVLVDDLCQPSFLQTFRSFMKLRLLLLFRSPKSVATIIITPIAIMLINYFLLNNVGGSKTTDSIKLSPSLYSPSYHVKLQNQTGSSLDRMDSYFADMTLETDFVEEMSLLNLTPSYMGIAMKKLELGAKLDILWSWYFNDTAVHYLPILQNTMTNFYGSLLNDSKIKKLEVTSEPFQKTPGNDDNAFDATLYTWTILLSTILGYLPTAIAVEVVEDREAQIKNQLRVSGLSFGMYWLMTTFAHSLVLFLPIAVLVIGIIAMDILHSAMAILALILLCLLFIPSSLIYTYVLTFMFDRHDTAKSVMPTICFFMSFLPMIVVFMVYFSSRGVSTVLHIIFSILSPYYSPTGGMFFIIQVNQNLKLQRLLNFPADESAYFYMSNNVTPTILIMVFNIFVYLLLLRIVDVLKSGGSLMDALFLKRSKQQFTLNPQHPQHEEIDVAAERNNVLNSTNAQQPVLVIQELGKNYFKTVCGRRTPPGKVAVHNLSLAVDRGHIFGLLGPNGAGKTSTMRIVIAEESPTYGKVAVAGYNITSNLSDAFKLIGYCPQHDALWNNITLEEHVRLYAGIRGIRTEDLNRVCNKLMTALNVDEHAKKRAKELSGGTKRKLLYIISILGSPQLVLLDEPSTGMDPQSKRFLWDTICSAFPANGGRTVVLTTHSMEEADILCTRIGIMVNGFLKCIGSSQHLKNKYGGGYTLDMKIEDLNKMEDVTSFVSRIFPTSSQGESFGNRIAFNIPKEGVLSTAEAFSSIEKAKRDLGVEEYSLSQTSLEQVFLQFAKQQEYAGTN